MLLIRLDVHVSVNVLCCLFWMLLLHCLIDCLLSQISYYNVMLNFIASRKGNVGVVHYIDSEESFNWLLHEGKHDPYVPLFTAEYFTQ